MSIADHGNADIIREALFAAKNAWFSGRVFADGQIHVSMSAEEFNERVAVGIPALDALLNEHADALADKDAEIERLRRMLPEHCTCDPDHEIRCHVCAALAAAQQPPKEEQT